MSLGRDEIKSSIRVHDFGVEVQVPEDLFQLTLPEIARAGLVPEGVRVLLGVAEHRAPPLQLAVVFQKTVDPRRGGELEVNTGVAGLEPRFVGAPRQSELIDVLDPPGAVQPESVPDDRSPDIGPVKIDFVDT